MTAGVLLTNTTPGLIDLGLMFARVFLGVCFVVHGLGKLGIVGDGNLAGFADWLGSLALCFVLFLTGPGALSLDAMIF